MSPEMNVMVIRRLLNFLGKNGICRIVITFAYHPVSQNHTGIDMHPSG